MTTSPKSNVSRVTRQLIFRFDLTRRFMQKFVWSQSQGGVGLGSPGPIELIASLRLAIPAFVNCDFHNFFRSQIVDFCGMQNFHFAFLPKSLILCKKSFWIYFWLCFEFTYLIYSNKISEIADVIFEWKVNGLSTIISVSTRFSMSVRDCPKHTYFMFSVFQFEDFSLHLGSLWGDGGLL